MPSDRPGGQPRTTASGAPAPGTSVASLLLLVDGRLPTGGHAHSGGIEAAVADGRVRVAPDLERYLEGRLATAGLVDAALAAATAGGRASIALLNGEAQARCASPALRRASVAQARGLLRAARHIWPSPALDEIAASADNSGLMWPIVLGSVARAAGLRACDAAVAAAVGSVTGPAWAAVRLLGLDPFEVVAALGRLAPRIDEIASAADAAARIAPPSDLPARGSPLLDIAAQRHATWEVRLFVS